MQDSVLDKEVSALISTGAQLDAAAPADLALYQLCVGNRW